MSAPLELPLHRSLLRAALLGPLAAFLPVLIMSRSENTRIPPFLMNFVGFSGWTATLVLASDLAGTGHWLRRALIVLLVPVLMPLALLTVLIVVRDGDYSREATWNAPALAVETIRRTDDAGVALILAGLVPFAVLLACRACAARRPMWAHALVIVTSSYASLLLFQHLVRDLVDADPEDTLDLGRQVMLLGVATVTLILLHLEARLGGSRRELLRGLAGRWPPRASAAGLETALAAFLIALGLAWWVHPAHHAWSIERRARAGEVGALRAAIERAEDPRARYLAALDSSHEEERVAAFWLDYRSTLGSFPELQERARQAVRSDPSPRVRAAALLELAGEGLEEELAGPASDPDPTVALVARVVLCQVGQRPFPLVEALPLMEAAERFTRAMVATRILYYSPSQSRVSPDRRISELEEVAVAILALEPEDAPLQLQIALRHLRSRGASPRPELRAFLGKRLAGAEVDPELAELIGLDETR